jgi:hypothetical protein
MPRKVINHCAYCQKQVDRNVFCRNSHRVMFFLKKKKQEEKMAAAVLRKALASKPNV